MDLGDPEMSVFLPFVTIGPKLYNNTSNNSNNSSASGSGGGNNGINNVLISTAPVTEFKKREPCEFVITDKPGGFLNRSEKHKVIQTLICYIYFKCYVINRFFFPLLMWVLYFSLKVRHAMLLIFGTI